MSNHRFLETLLFPPPSLNSRKLARRISGKTILITGASSGIGERTALLLSDYPVHLVLAGRNEEKLAALKQEIETRTAKVSVVAGDLRQEEEMGRLLDHLHALPHGVDIIVSNAGLSIHRTIQDSLDRFHDYSRTMAINYSAPVRLLLSTIPLLKERGGHVVNVSTVNALLLPLPHWAAYQASKAAFDTWFRSAAPELAALGIATTTVYLPLVRTPMIEPTAKYRTMPAMSADRAARIICKSLYTKKRRYRPWWLFFGQTASLLFRGLFERIAEHREKRRVRG
ncbi:SDR family NAD(P)-dependent oxidoreductase [Gorillibacterium timonense]|uniref:SDR family NAD(P)-dependent oxidoreductase n=1 Tax=Gorillibacterium timonense TaxID=1689269 RepID=UPI00071CE943|nr:SDR family NAD(P)-dependent oxidoreductase [Gorillibacterium timonense]